MAQIWVDNNKYLGMGKEDPVLSAFAQMQETYVFDDDFVIGREDALAKLANLHARLEGLTLPMTKARGFFLRS